MSENPSCIVVENLVKTYGHRRTRALDGVSLEVQEGEIFGLIGPNGAGKTTLMGCLLSLLRPSSGKISIFGHSPDMLEVKKNSAFLPERPNFDAWMTAWQFMRYQHLLALRPQSLADSEIESALREVELDQSAWHRRIKKFSRGMLQRLGLAQMLLGQPRLCFLDEPGSGMDPLGTALLRRILLSWKEKNVTVILNSHHLDELEKICDRVAFIKKGRIEKVESISRLSTADLVMFARLESNFTLDERNAVELANELREIQAELIKHETGSLRLRLNETTSKSAVLRLLVEKEIPVEEVFQEKRGLEDLFISIHKTEESH